jgi:hypothetical protein
LSLGVGKQEASQSNDRWDINSQVSVNTDAGFSIVKWTGNNLASQTIGHGLSSTPEITIIKKLTGTALDWQVNLNSSITGTEGYLNLNLTVALYTTFPNYYTSANSTVLSTNGTTTAERQYNNQSADYIAYCFHSVAGALAFSFSEINPFVQFLVLVSTFTFTVIQIYKAIKK